MTYSLEAFRASAVEEIVLVAPPGEVEAFCCLIAAGPAAKTEKVVAGGATRQDSVMQGLRALTAGTAIVLVHDAARPLVSVALIEACAAAARRHGAAIAALPLADTLKRVEGETITATAPREALWLAQTPQAFRVELLVEACQRAQRQGAAATDDSALVEAMGQPVAVVMGSPGNIKITYPRDLALAERLLAAQVRCGIGYDVHRLAPGRRLILGGVEFPGEVGLAGHSDADVLAHAVCDALLGAAGLGDIGRHFPDTDPRYAGADSLELLRQAAGMVTAAGFRVVNVDAVVVAQRPRIADRAPEMQRRLGAALGIAPQRVNVKGKTTEGLGFVGAGEGIASHAVCSVAPGSENHNREGT